MNVLYGIIKVLFRFVLLVVGIGGLHFITEYYGIGLSNYFAPPSLIAATRKLPPISKIEIYRFPDHAESIALEGQATPCRLASFQ